MQEIQLNELTEEQIDQQEHLSKTRFKYLKPKYVWEDDLRPKNNLVDLMHWSKEKFGFELSKANKSDLGCFIHNKIVMDGSFFEFAEKNGIKIECLYRDSVASWESDFNNEHFMAQGVFKISHKKTEFLHAALFHKGNQNEDEVSFFVIVDDKSFFEYLEIRNKFSKWLLERDRESLQVYVAGSSDSYAYSRDSAWEDLFLPENLKKQIKDSVEGFLKAKPVYEKMKVPWKRGILLHGEPGCGKSSTIKTIISNYDFKPVTIQAGSNTNDDTVIEAFQYAQEQSPSLLYLEDLDNLLEQINYSNFLNLMDGVCTRNGLLIIATANDLSRLKESVTDRPSRFDRKWHIPLPDLDMSKAYLKKWFGKILNKNEYEKIAEISVKNNFSYAYLKDIYLTSVFYALAEDREKPTVSDIFNAIEQLKSDKDDVNDGFELPKTGRMGVA